MYSVSVMHWVRKAYQAKELDALVSIQSFPSPNWMKLFALPILFWEKIYITDDNNIICSNFVSFKIFKKYIYVFLNILQLSGVCLCWNVTFFDSYG